MVSGSNDLAALATRGWVSLRQFANIAGVSYPTVCRMRDRGNIQTTQVGGIFRVNADEVKRFLRDGNLPSGVQAAVVKGGGEQSPPIPSESEQEQFQPEKDDE